MVLASLEKEGDHVRAELCVEIRDDVEYDFEDGEIDELGFGPAHVFVLLDAVVTCSAVLTECSEVFGISEVFKDESFATAWIEEEFFDLFEFVFGFGFEELLFFPVDRKLVCGHFPKSERESTTSESFVDFSLESLLDYSVFLENIEDTSNLHSVLNAGFLGHDTLGFEHGRTASFTVFEFTIERIIEFEDAFFGWIAVLDEELLDLGIAVAREYDPKRSLPITPSTADFLVVVFDRTGEIVVDDEPDVLLVDPHPESIGCDDDLVIVVHEGILCVFAIPALHRAGVHPDVDVILLEKIIHFAHNFTAGTINNPRTRNLLDDIKGLCEFVVLGADFSYEDDDVLAVETLGEHRVLRETESFDDVVADFLGCRRGECNDGEGLFCTEVREEISDPHIARSEIMSPLTHTVCLIDRDERDLDIGYRTKKCLGIEALGSDVEEFDRSFAFGIWTCEITKDVLLCSGINGGIDALCAKPKRIKLVDLILHQRDEWGDDDRHSRSCDPRKLIRE